MDVQSAVYDERGWHGDGDQIWDEYLTQLIRQFPRINDVHLFHNTPK